MPTLLSYIYLNIMKKNIMLYIFLFIALQVGAISPTKYDYTQLSRQITSGCKSKYSQSLSIFKWICENISYDTSHQVSTADDCLDCKKGVCQAYCELFYRLAEPLGLKTKIVRGMAKHVDGSISNQGHTWIVVQTETKKILIDPTWGAGGVDNGAFVKNDNYMSWFDVDPYWLIFTHFPQYELFQMISQPIDYDTFKKLPGNVRPFIGKYGLNAKKMYHKALRGQLSLPIFYDVESANIKIVKMPLKNSLQIGHLYEIVIQKRTNHKIGLINNGLIIEDEWHKNGSNYSIKFVPTSTKKISLVINCGGNEYAHILSYDVK